ncbi:hypothetical protein BWI97_07765 [Siphonobacter sp. BAB-5405]|uniref:hypothetical protein n=1 Tax=Siphonobacter sp. BAB-5405 TaxID=1864825 RepID=UPI000C80E14D|nr:hypothetical protein [Siphonobacter sp. BAB-5405]PMD97515.1 hypothetical protein BWI97_07765 [Siphonobacter sp. BAB-5405]
MTPTKKGTFVRKAKDITIGGTLTLALLTGAITLQSCGNNSEERQYETREETTFGKGVRTYITETSPGEFKITDEVSVAADSAQAIVRYYDGHRDTLTAQAAKALIDKEVINNQQYHAGHSGLGSALLWGGMGYFLANSLNNRRYQQFQTQYGDQQRSRFYTNPAVFSRSNNVRQEVQSSRRTQTVRTSRPSGGRSGFFGGSRSRSYGG